MKKFIKKISLLLFLSLSLTLFAPFGVSANTVSIDEMKTKIRELQIKYPEDSYWGKEFDGGIECFGFANLCYTYIFDDSIYYANTHNDVDELCVGDWVRYRSSSNSKANHSIFITDIIGNSIFYVDCNGEGDDCVHWGNIMSKDDLKSKLTLRLYEYEYEDYTLNGFGYIKTYPYNNVTSLSRATTKSNIILPDEAEKDVDDIYDDTSNDIIINEALSDTEITPPIDDLLNPNPEIFEDKNIIFTIGKKEVIVFGKSVFTDTAPIIRNERTMLPARFISETLGADVFWNEPDSIIISKNSSVLKIKLGSQYADIDGNQILIDSPAFIENGRTYAPLRLIVDFLKGSISYDITNNQVIITP